MLSQPHVAPGRERIQLHAPQPRMGVAEQAGKHCHADRGGNRNFAGWELIGYPGVRLAVTAEQQNLDARPAPTRMSAYDYSMFSRRKPADGH